MSDCNGCTEQIIFRKYSGTDETFVMPEDVTAIADGAFAYNKILRHIDLRNVRYIGAYAFQDCSSLETVIMPEADVIGAGAFEFCRSLRSVDFGNITEIRDGAFAFCGMLDIPAMPRSLTDVGAGAFSHTAVRRADLHWLKDIPPHLFSCCTSLSFADVSGAKVIGEGAFEECRALSYVRFGDAEKIEAKAFYKCDSLEPASLPDTLLEIGDDAFSAVRPGTVVPRGVRYIGSNCFGPVDRRKDIRIYKSSLYGFRNYFRDERDHMSEDNEHFYMWESSIDVTVLDDRTGENAGFLPLFSDLYDEMRKALIGAFRSDDSFDYSVLDTVFVTEMRWNLKCRDRLAVMRLKYPYELSESARRDHTGYLRKHQERIARRAIRDRDIEILAFLSDSDMISEADITELLDYSISLSSSECTAILLERQARMDRYDDAMFDEL